MRLVLGVDAGGTSTRAALFTLEGAAVRRGRAGGANPGSLGADLATANLTAAVRDAVAGVAPQQVAGVVVGMAGHQDACAALAGRVLSDVLPGAPVESVGDIVTAFTAGTAAASGAVLISGTGAIAAKITGRRAVGTADGFGWLLGDEGSAFWLGRAAARTTIRHLATGGEPESTRPPGGGGGGGELAGLVVGWLAPGGLGADPVAGLAAAVHARPPLALAELAPLVGQAAAAGDPVAVAIVRKAASLLVATLRTVHDSGPVVLAGSVLTSEGPVRQAVTALLTGEPGHPVRTVTTAGDPAGAAAWLAARALLPAAAAEAAHAAFTV